VNYAEGIYVGYRYFDTKGVEPLFPFGHGLSYTQFKYDNLKTGVAEGRVNVSLDVKNTGGRAGAEVVQVYVRDPQASVDRPQKELKAFRKVFLKPGEKKTVTMTLDRRALAFYDETSKGWVVEPGVFEIIVGSSSRDIRLSGAVNWPAE
jgi:beta-glucosidase